MSRSCVEHCGRLTNEKDGVCVPCKMINKTLAPALKERAKSITRENMHIPGNGNGGNMAIHVAKEKICTDCNKPFKPASNVQQRCPSCKDIHQQNKKKEYQGRYLKKKRKTLSPPGRSTGSPLQDSPTSTLPIFPASPLSSNGKYHVEVDFSRLPKLHAQLLKQAEQELRDPGNQLLFMLREEFEKLEKEIA